jgi:hypothetical protein
VGKSSHFCLSATSFIPTAKRSVTNCCKILDAEICYLYDASRQIDSLSAFAEPFSVCKPYILTFYVLNLGDHDA